MFYRQMTVVFLSLLLGSRVFGEQFSLGFEGFFREYEIKPAELAARFLPPNPVIFEAGGHYGHDTVRFMKQWPNATVICFEPNPYAFDQLIETCKPFPNILPYNLAVNDYNGNATLYLCYGSTGDNPIYEGASSLLEPSEWMKIHYQGPKVKVSCVILDDWCSENQIDHIDFIWLDLEGSELQALKSSPKILETVKVVYTETNFKDYRKGTTQYHELKEFLIQAGFELFSHWFTPEVQGNAMFVRKEIFYMGFKSGD